MAQGQRRRAEKDTSPAAEVTSLGAEELYRAVADSTSDWEYWLDPQGNYVFLSPACERLTGYTREEFLADPRLVERLVHPDDRAGFEQHIERVHLAEQQRNAIELELRIIARDGSERWISHRCAGMFDPDGRYLGRRASNVDVSRYKLAEEKLLLLNRGLLTVRDSTRTVLRATDELKLMRAISGCWAGTSVTASPARPGAQLRRQRAGGISHLHRLVAGQAAAGRQSSGFVRHPRQRELRGRV